MTPDSLAEIKLTLENDGNFYREYCKCVVINTHDGVAGKSADVQRRDLINKYARQIAMHLPYPDMRERVELQRYFDERWELCPYGLRSREEMNADKHTEHPTTQEKEMKNMKVIETKVFVHGQDASTLTDDDLFGRIATIEAEIKKLEGIENKPNKLKEKIDDMKRDINDLVKLVDSRK